MAQTPAEVLRSNLEIISRSKSIVTSVQNDWRQGKISKENALQQINNAKIQANDATKRIAAYERANRSSLATQGLTSSFTSAEDQGDDVVKFAENSYKYITYNNPDQTGLPVAKKELSVLKASIVPQINNNQNLLQELNALANRNASKSEIDAAISKAKTGLENANKLLDETVVYINKSANANLAEEKSWGETSKQTTDQQIVEFGKVLDKLQKKQPTATNIAGATGATGASGPPASNPGADPANNTTPGVNYAQAQAKLKDTTNFEAKKDWRVRLSLSPGAEYLYKAKNPGILSPLKNTDGVIFPYTPNITISYNANYDPTSVTHSNYKIYQYLNSSVDQVNITCDFTAQDTYEANYLLAVIHFFRSVTKMFYGLDENPKGGTPPPLCYLFGLGQFQFNAHPLVVSSFTYSLPSEVDYIRSDPSGAVFIQEIKTTGSRSSIPERQKPSSVLLDAIQGSIKNSRLGQGIAKLGRVIGVDLIPGGNLEGPSFQDNTGFNSLNPPGVVEPTYVPTKIQIQITCIPIVSRYDISNTFSLQDYAQGRLLQGVKRSGGGIW